MEAVESLRLTGFQGLKMFSKFEYDKSSPSLNFSLKGSFQFSYTTNAE